MRCAGLTCAGRAWRWGLAVGKRSAGAAWPGEAARHLRCRAHWQSLAPCTAKGRRVLRVDPAPAGPLALESARFSRTDTARPARVLDPRAAATRAHPHRCSMLAGLATTLGDRLLAAGATAVAPPSHARHTQTVRPRACCAAWQSLGQPAERQAEAEQSELRAHTGERQVRAHVYVSRDCVARATSKGLCAVGLPRVEQDKLALHRVGPDAIGGDVVRPQPPASKLPKGSDCAETNMWILVGTCLRRVRQR